jgi:hypothetical protein
MSEFSVSRLNPLFEFWSVVVCRLGVVSKSVGPKAGRSPRFILEVGLGVSKKKNLHVLFFLFLILYCNNNL